MDMEMMTEGQAVVMIAKAAAALVNEALSPCACEDMIRKAVRAHGNLRYEQGQANVPVFHDEVEVCST